MVLVLAMVLSVFGCTAAPAPDAAAPAPAAEAAPAAPAAETAPEVEVRNIVYAFPGTAARLNVVNTDGSYGGYEIEIIKALDEALPQYTFELYCTGEFSALTAGLDSDKFDMVGSNITWKQERAEKYLYSDVSYYSCPYMIGVAKDNDTIKGVADLQGKEVLVITGTAQAIYLEGYNEQHKDNPVKLNYVDASAQDCISQVFTGRYEACIHNKADFAIAADNGYELKAIDIPDSDTISLPDGYFLFDTEEDQLKADVDEQLKIMKADGTLSKLCLQFFPWDLVPADKEAAAPTGEVRNIVYAFPGTAARLNIVNTDGSFGGYEIEIIKALDEALPQYTFELYCTGEFSALTAGLDADKFDMVGSNITWKQERAEKYLYSDVSYYSCPYMIGVAKDNDTIKGVADLQGKEVLVITGTAQAIYLEGYNEQHKDNPIKLNYVDASAQDCISQVFTGRYEACIHNMADFAIAADNGYELKAIDIPDSDTISLPDGYFLFDTEEDQLKADVDEQLTAMKADGTLSKLCLQFFPWDLVPAAK